MSRKVVSHEVMLNAIVDEMLFVQSKFEELRRGIGMEVSADEFTLGALSDVSDAMDKVLDGLVLLPGHSVFSSKKKVACGFWGRLRKWVFFG